VDVDLDDAGIRRDRELADARVARRRVALHAHRRAVRARRFLDGGHQLEVALGAGDGRHEDVHDAVAHLDAKSGAHDAVPVLL
jgi:hypothetical protein